MKIMKIMPCLASSCLAVPTTSLVAYADSLPDKEYIVSEIWSDWWVGKDDNGRTFPEASFKHHILEKWVGENCSGDYYRSDPGELRFCFKEYYKGLTKGWDFNDDDNGNRTIDADKTTYHFSLDNGQWLMIDSNGDTVDTFIPFSTLDEKNTEVQKEPDNPSHRITGKLPQEMAVTAANAVSQEDITSNAENRSVTSDSTSKGLLYVIGAMILAGLVIIGIMLYRRKNTEE